MDSLRPGRPLLTVAIPAFNNGHLLALTLDSLTRQTMPREDFEVVVIDDGSEPTLEPTVRGFADRLQVVYLRHSPNRGRAITRNRGIAAARGGVVLFIDADSCAHPRLVERHWDYH